MIRSAWKTEFEITNITDLEVGKFYLDTLGVLYCYLGVLVDTKVAVERQKPLEVFAKVGCMIVTRKSNKITVHDFKLGCQEIQNRVLDIIELDKDNFASNLLRIGKTRPTRLCAEIACLELPIGTMKYLIRQRGLSSIEGTYTRGGIYQDSDGVYYWYLGKLNWSWITSEVVASLVTDKESEVTPTGVTRVLGKQEDVFLNLGTELGTLTEKYLLSRLTAMAMDLYDLGSTSFMFTVDKEVKRVQKSQKWLPPISLNDVRYNFKYSLCI